MIARLLPRQPLRARVRLAVFFSFLAVLSALLAPASMLAEEVRTGRLGGTCSASASSASGADAGTSGALQPGAGCALCGAPGWCLPPMAFDAIPSFAGQQVAAADVPAAVAGKVAGLPFSRGPPVPGH